jgi:CheY-like chemotaxis protein
VNNLFSGRKVLLVEDEPIVAWLLQDMLVDLGLVVVGPAASVNQALAKIDAESIDMAVLDVNLKGQMSYPIADVLVARGVPFVFSTGYDSRLSDLSGVAEAVSSGGFVRCAREIIGVKGAKRQVRSDRCTDISLKHALTRHCAKPRRPHSEARAQLILCDEGPRCARGETTVLSTLRSFPLVVHE